MKARTIEFKNQIAKLYESKDVITYTLNGSVVTLTDEDIYSIQPHYETQLLKSVMKCLDIVSKYDITKDTVINYRLGIKTREGTLEDYDYISYGNYVVYSSEKQEDTDTYLIKCYDKMLYSMIDYVSLNITYPITVRNYISAICSHLRLTFKNANTTFVNYNKEIPKELYLDGDGNNIGYKFRDVLDELAQVTASNIVINEEDDELEIRYITETNDTINEEYFDEDNVNFGEVYGPLNTIILSRSEDSDIFTKSYPTDLADNLKKAIKIKDNQIMNFDDRGSFVDEILDKLKGLTFTTNNYKSKGILYYNVCDKYTASIFNTNYTCIMLNDDVINDDSGIEENVHTDIPEDATTDYSKATSEEKIDIKTKLIVDKQAGEIRATVSNLGDEINGVSNRVTSAESKLTSQEASITFMEGNFNEDGSVKSLSYENNETTGIPDTEFTYYKFDKNGLKMGKSTEDYNSLQNNKGTFYYEKDTMIGKYTKDGSVQKDLALYGKYYYGIDEEQFNVNTFSLADAKFVAQWYDNGTEEGFGHFWNGE